jgi:hypothetical protein
MMKRNVEENFPPTKNVCLVKKAVNVQKGKMPLYLCKGGLQQVPSLSMTIFRRVPLCTVPRRRHHGEAGQKSDGKVRFFLWNVEYLSLLLITT